MTRQRKDGWLGMQIDSSVERALKPRQIWAIRFFLDREGRMRDRALFDLAIDSKLRGVRPGEDQDRHVVSGREIRARSVVALALAL